MRKISFIGCYDKIDLILYVAKILVAMDRRVLVVDSSINQKAKYIVPVIKPTKAYVTEFEEIDVAVGFDTLEEIKEYLGILVAQNCHMTWFYLILIHIVESKILK